MKKLSAQIRVIKKFGFKNKKFGFNHSRFGFKKVLTGLEDEWVNVFNRNIELLFQFDEENYPGEMKEVEERVNALNEKLRKADTLSKSV